MSWEAFRSVASMGSFFVALAALVISFTVWRSSRSNEVMKMISEGDSKLSGRLNGIEEGQRDIELKVSTLDTRVQHGITRQDIDNVHLRVNSISREVSAIGAEVKSSNALLIRMDDFLRSKK